LAFSIDNLPPSFRRKNVILLQIDSFISFAAMSPSWSDFLKDDLVPDDLKDRLLLVEDLLSDVRAILLLILLCSSSVRSGLLPGPHPPDHPAPPPHVHELVDSHDVLFKTGLTSPVGAEAQREPVAIFVYLNHTKIKRQE
jgi:hypothetical protein